MRASALAGSVALLAVACGGAHAIVSPPPQPPPKDVVPPEAQALFDSGVRTMTAHDAAGDWTREGCTSTAASFDAAASAARDRPSFAATALYDAALVYQRCRMDADAQKRFDQALRTDPSMTYARAQMALYALRARGDVDAAIEALERVVSDSRFDNAPALVDLAMLQLARDSARVGANCVARSGGADVPLADHECAKLNLQRALAVDDAYMPAYNGLALYYFTGGRKHGAAPPNRQGLELAALVCSQAEKKNARYAPIHNTAGLVAYELGQVNAAVREFQTAGNLDPDLYEARMNLAAVNLGFRGFEQAERAYAEALRIRPDDFDAHLGHALALRGNIGDSNYDAQVTAVKNELATCAKIAPDRPESYFNHAVLTQEFEAKHASEKATQLSLYDEAETLFRAFLTRAQGKKEYESAVSTANERIGDIEQIKTLLDGGP
jgi:tetratricopeptide (TPR) repeat protein